MVLLTEKILNITYLEGDNTYKAILIVPHGKYLIYVKYYPPAFHHHKISIWNK